MQTGYDVLERALNLLRYSDLLNMYTEQMQGCGLAIVNQIYIDLWFTCKSEPFSPLETLEQPLLLPQKQLEDVMPYGVAMLLALSEGDGDNQQLYAAVYNRKRAASTRRFKRLDILFKRQKGDAS